MKLEKKYVEEMVAHARAEDPLECCGLLAGKDGKIIKLYRTTNAAASGERYLMVPQELFSIFKELDDNGWEVIAIYHSHTHTEAYPSPTDVQLAYWSEPLYLIVSLKDKTNPTIRAFHIRQGNIEEEELAVLHTPYDTAQTLSTKLQTPNKFKGPNTETQNSYQLSAVGVQLSTIGLPTIDS